MMEKKKTRFRFRNKEIIEAERFQPEFEWPDDVIQMGHRYFVRNNIEVVPGDWIIYRKKSDKPKVMSDRVFRTRYEKI